MKTNQATHTPGPWRIARTSDGREVIAEDAGQILTIAYAQAYLHKASPDEEARANARLIAAAPALLKACEAIITDLELFVSRQGPGPDARLAALKAAIAQAEGGE